MNKTIAVFFLVISINCTAQDSGLAIWNDLANDTSIETNQLVTVAHLASVELRIAKLYLEVCQEYQPLPERESEAIFRKLEQTGVYILTFYESLAPETLAKAGLTNDSPAEENYQAQKTEMPKQFPALPETEQEAFCSGFRSEIKEMVQFADVVPR